MSAKSYFFSPKMANPDHFTAVNNEIMLNPNESAGEDVKTLAASYMMYKIGKCVYGRFEIIISFCTLF